MLHRAGNHARERAIKSRREYVRANRRLLITVNLGFAMCAVAVVLLTARIAPSDVAFFVAGASVMSTAFMLWVTAESTPARRQFDGAEGERLTAGVLRGLRWKGWKNANNVDFRAGDVDHVVAGPGGVFAIETKWTNDSCEISGEMFTNEWDRKAVRQARVSADRIGWLLAGNYNIPCQVKALLVIWGPGRPKLDEPVPMGDVLVVTGQLLRSVIAGMDAADINVANVVSEALDDFSRMRSQHGNECPQECKCASVVRDLDIVSASISESVLLVRPRPDQRAA